MKNPVGVVSRRTRLFGELSPESNRLRRMLWAFLDLSPRCSTVRIPMGAPSGPLLVRLGRGQTDVQVAREVFRDHEYQSDTQSAKMIVDLGANVGYSAVWYAQVFPQSVILAVEPDPTNFGLLLKNTERRGMIHCVNAAIGPVDGTVCLFDEGRGPWGLRTWSESRPLSEGREVKMISMPTLLRQFGADQIDILKVDIEGAEFELFSNADSWLPRVRELIAEVHDRFRPGCSSSVTQALRDWALVTTSENIVHGRRTHFASDGALGAQES